MAIQFVGGTTASKVGATSGNSTIALNSGLTGGIASAVAADDLVVAVFGTGSTTNRTLAITDGSTDYTLIGSELYSNDTLDTNLRVAYKFMGATPDTATTFGPTGSFNDAGGMAVYVFRGVDLTTPLDVAAVTGTGINTSRVVPPDITPSTAGAFPVVAGAAGHNGGTDTFTSSDLTDFRTVGGNDSNDVTIGVGHQDNWTSGATNYATWGHSQADSTGFSWAAVTLALRPAAGGAADFPGTGALAAQAAVVAGSGLHGRVSSGALAAQAAVLAGTGTVGRVSSGTLTVQDAAVSGAGTVGRVGSGALTAQDAALSGAGTVSRAGSGTLVVGVAILSGTGHVNRTATGNLQAQDATIIGAGTSLPSGLLPTKSKGPGMVNLAELMNRR